MLDFYEFEAGMATPNKYISPLDLIHDIGPTPYRQRKYSSYLSPMRELDDQKYDD